MMIKYLCGKCVFLVLSKIYYLSLYVPAVWFVILLYWTMMIYFIRYCKIMVVL